MNSEWVWKRFCNTSSSCTRQERGTFIQFEIYKLLRFGWCLAAVCFRVSLYSPFRRFSFLFFGREKACLLHDQKELKFKFSASKNILCRQFKFVKTILSQLLISDIVRFNSEMKANGFARRSVRSANWITPSGPFDRIINCIQKLKWWYRGSESTKYTQSSSKDETISSDGCYKKKSREFWLFQRTS